MEQTEQEIEHIARAFFVAWNETEAWEDASQLAKHEFRLYARHAIGILERRHGLACNDGHEAGSARSLEAA